MLRLLKSEGAPKVPQIGAQVRILGLETRSDLNGQVATVPYVFKFTNTFGQHAVCELNSQRRI